MTPDRAITIFIFRIAGVRAKCTFRVAYMTEGERPNSLLGGSENHTPSVPPFREPGCFIGQNNRKTIAVQCSLADFTQAWEWFAGPTTTCSARYTTQIG